MSIALTTTQIAIIGVLSSVLTWLIGLVIEKGIPWFLEVTKWKPGVTIDLGRWVKTILVGLSAFGLAWWWYPATLPPWTGFANFGPYLEQLLSDLTPYVGAAMSIYNLILGYVLDPAKRAQFFKWLLELFAPK